MTDLEKIKLLRDSLDNVWCDLGKLVLESGKNITISQKSLIDICDRIADDLNDTDSKLENVTGRNRGLYAEYQPMEVLQFMKGIRADSSQSDNIPL